MARVLAFTRGAAAVLDALTTVAGLSWVMAIDKDNKRLRIFDGTTAGGVALAKLSDIPGAAPHVYSVPASGVTVTMAAGDRKLQLDPATDLAALTVVLPPGAADEDVFELSTSKTITALTVGGQTVTLSANGGMGWWYRGANATWYRRY